MPVFPSRFFAFAACAVLTVLMLVGWIFHPAFLWPFLVCALLTAVGIHDVLQTRHAICRNYPILAHLRFLLEYVRPEIRQYFIESDSVSEPFSRNQRSVVYQRAKRSLETRPFGTQLDVYQNGYEWINHSIAPVHPDDSNFRIRVGETGGPEPQRKPGVEQPYDISVFNISAIRSSACGKRAILPFDRRASGRGEEIRPRPCACHGAVAARTGAGSGDILAAVLAPLSTDPP